MENAFLKLPFVFDPALLEKDLAVCREKFWIKHFNQNDFSGKWESISLRSLSGKEDDIYSHPGIYQDTPLLKKCSYFSSVLDLFQCEKESVRLLSLHPSGIIKEHRDLKVGYEYGIFRVHIPVRTGPRVSFCVGGTELGMKAGESWYANFDLPHHVENHGEVERIHLIMDCIRNTWSDEIFSKAGYNFEEERRKKTYKDETTEKIIAELELMESDVASRLIAGLRSESKE